MDETSCVFQQCDVMWCEYSCWNWQYSCKYDWCVRLCWNIMI